jgi:serine/threonine protein phosphatase PrpC
MGWGWGWDLLAAGNLHPIAAGSARGQLHLLADKPNQDRYGINAKATAGFISICVCDGHGPEGELAADTAAKHMMLEVERQVLAGAGGEDAVRAAVHAAAQAINSQPFAYTSGTTATIALLLRKELFVAGVGDCEAVLVTTNSRSRVSTELMTQAHKTYNVEEKARIEQAGGIIQAGYVVSKLGTQLIKSLNITRALGDLDLRHCGVIETPCVVSRHLVKNDSLLIIGTDGLWGDADGESDVAPHEFFGEAANKFAQSPLAAVKKLFEMVGKAEDDITVVIMRLDM